MTESSAKTKDPIANSWESVGSFYFRFFMGFSSDSPFLLWTSALARCENFCKFIVIYF